MQRGRGRRRRQPQVSGPEKGVTAGEAVDKNIADKAHVSVDDILEQARILSASTGRKLSRRQMHADTQIAARSTATTLDEAGGKQALAASDERAFFIEERRTKHEIAVRDHPDKMRLWLEFAKFEETVARDLGRCRDVFQRAAEHLTKNADMTMQRVLFEERLGNFGVAIDICLRGASRFPKDERLYYRIAHLQECLGELDDNPFERWIARVSPIDADTKPASFPPLESFKCPLHEGVPHAAFERAVEWILKNQKAKWRRELFAIKDKVLDSANHPTLDSARQLCQRYVCTYNDSTSWAYYANTEADAFADIERAEHAFIAGIYAVPTTMDGNPPFRGESCILKLQVFHDFVEFLTKKNRYNRHRATVVALWHEHFSHMQKTRGAVDEATLPQVVTERLQSSVSFSQDGVDVAVFDVVESNVLSAHEEKLYLATCDLLQATEQVRFTLEANVFLAFLRTDRVCMQFIHRVKGTAQRAKKLIHDEWIDADASKDRVIHRIPPDADVFEAVTELLKMRECEVLSAANCEIVLDAICTAFEFGSLVNTLALQSFKSEQTNLDTFRVRVVDFLQSQQNYVLFISDYLAKATNNAALSKDICTGFVDLLMRINDFLLVKPKKAHKSKARKKTPTMQVCHPVVVSLAQPIWVHMALLEPRITPESHTMLRKMLGMAIGKASAAQMLQGVDEQLIEATDGLNINLKQFFDERPSQCPCTYPNTLEALNGIFDVYLAQEAEFGESGRLVQVAANWAQKIHEVGARGINEIIALNTTLAEDDEVDRYTADLSRKALVHLFVYVCMHDALWEPWTVDAAEAGECVSEAQQKSTELFVALLRTLHKATAAVFPVDDSKSVSEQLKRIVSALHSTKVVEDDGALLQAVRYFWEVLSTATGIASGEPCAVCKMAVSIENGPDRAPKIQKVNEAIFSERQNASLKHKILEGNFLSPSSTDWGIIYSRVSSDLESNGTNGDCAAFANQRIRTLAIMLWAAAVVANRRRAAPSLPVSEQIAGYIANRSAQGAESGLDPLCFAQSFLQANIKLLADELAIYASTMLATVDAVSAENAGKCFEMLALIVYVAQFFTTIAKHASFREADATELAIEMWDVILGPKGESVNMTPMTLADIFTECSPAAVTIEGADDAELNSLVSKCIVPLKESSTYIGNVQPGLDSRFDDGLNALQHTLINICHAYVQKLLGWTMDGLREWTRHIDALVAEHAQADAQERGMLAVAAGEAPEKSFKLFALAEEAQNTAVDDLFKF